VRKDDHERKDRADPRAISMHRGAIAAGSLTSLAAVLAPLLP
jgi:hypothetical protein